MTRMPQFTPVREMGHIMGRGWWLPHLSPEGDPIGWQWQQWRRCANLLRHGVSHGTAIWRRACVERGGVWSIPPLPPSERAASGP